MPPYLRTSLILMVLFHSLVLSQKISGYDYSWEIIGTEIVLELKVKTTGWIGFGIAERTSGSMPGADFLIAYVINGVAKVEDRWTEEKTTPQLDRCQDWILISGYENSTHTVIKAKRALNTTDSQDRVIDQGSSRVILAYGLTDNFAYHGSNRWANALTFWGPVLTLPTGSSFDIALTNYTVPGKHTVYACQSFDLPVDRPYHAIAFEPIMLTHLLHHMLLFSCVPPYPGNYTVPQECETPQNSPSCSLVWAWATGQGPTALPELAGYRMGGGVGAAYHLILEVHYDNPNDISTVIDNSGVKVIYTDTLRQYDSDVLLLGDQYVKLPPIPGNYIDYEVEVTCPSECTSKFPYPLHVFADFMHMHNYGTTVWSTLHNNDTTTYMNRIEFWDFGYQQSNTVEKVIYPGDRINTHCKYNTEGSGSISFGLEAVDEMCLQYLYYYPRIPFVNCGYWSPTETYCGDTIIQVPNPSVIDPPGGGTREFGIPCSTGFPTTNVINPSENPNITDAPNGSDTLCVSEFWVLLLLLLMLNLVSFF